MQIPKSIIDDFKTDRKDILPPLPTSARLVPILCYGAVAGAILLSCLYILQIRISASRLEGHRQGLDSVGKSVAEARENRAALDEKILRATEVEHWVEGSRPLQPLVVAIARSIDEGSSILDMRLARQENAPDQLNLSLRIGTDSIAQLDRVIDAIQGQNYRIISPQQNISRGQIDYFTTLVWQGRKENSTEETPPKPEA